jgi:hypothetical protein
MKTKTGLDNGPNNNSNIVISRTTSNYSAHPATGNATIGTA